MGNVNEGATAGTSQKFPDVKLAKRGSREAPLVYVRYLTLKFLPSFSVSPPGISRAQLTKQKMVTPGSAVSFK